MCLFLKILDFSVKVNKNLEFCMKDFRQSSAGYYNPEACNLSDFKKIIDQSINTDTVPKAVGVENNIPIYDVLKFRNDLTNISAKSELMAEWAWVLKESSGVIVLRNAYQDTTVIDQATELYQSIIEQQKLGEVAGADHFAAAGANDRIWNSLQKLCESSPNVFFKYFANEAIKTACESWLGPNYQMTAQVNLVHPGGSAQQAHRDYHLGFQTAEVSSSYPKHVHELSPVLTLQGAIAHCDMPVESGPTKLLPFSQTYSPGYAAWRREDFREVFENNYVQLSLKKGDALFFNPAIFHAAGANLSSDVHRMANLLQVSSAFGRAMETIDRKKMCILTYPIALQHYANKSLELGEIKAAIAATAEGYSFPTNLDNDSPKGGLAPETQQEFFIRALENNIKREEFETKLKEMETVRLS
jgi:ectoine hydroxylase-related dioxygenase (phytanoyl-CoA dioxygenase family)